MPGSKRFLRRAASPPLALALLIRCAAAFIRHDGRLPASPAAGAVRSQARHRAALVRFRADRGWAKDWAALAAAAELLPRLEARRQGSWACLLDQTYCGQQRTKAENTFRRGNYRRRPTRGNRKNKELARRPCPCLVRGLLLTPSGLRSPHGRRYDTAGYCRAKGQGYRAQAQRAAARGGALAVPAGARVVAPGDAAFDAKDVRAACPGRGFPGVVPVNPERALAGPKPRPEVSAPVGGFRADGLAPGRLAPGRGPFAARRRAARRRRGPEGKGRTYYVPGERRAAHSVGEVLPVFSTKERPGPGKPVAVQKVLRADAVSLSAARVAGLYDWRRQIASFFRGPKGALGPHQYRLAGFAQVEGWAQAWLVTFAYLGW